MPHDVPRPSRIVNRLEGISLSTADNRIRNFPHRNLFPTCDVHDFTVCELPGGKKNPLDDIRNIRKIASLAATPENHGWFSAENPHYKFRNHFPVIPLKMRPRTISIKRTYDHSRQSVHLMENTHIDLASQLASPINRGRI